MMDDTLEALKALLEGATAGPWFVNPVKAWVEIPGQDAPICALLWPTELRSEDETFANGRCIVAMRNILPDLIADYERQRDEIADLKDELRRIIAADDQAPTKHGGLADCIDNDGAAYQSQTLANCLARARYALTSQDGEG